ncbi:MAG: zinc transport system permease protein [Alphaproteobacteria bacterium]|jgi:zinc transport system permease protein
MNMTMIMTIRTLVMNMLDPFILRAIAAGLGVAIIAGTIGCFVVWRKMAYFGDSLAHSALLGIALGLAIGISTYLSTIIACLAFALILLWLQQKNLLATDTLLGILAHAALSIGMIAISVLELRVNLHSYLFGDILTVTSVELWWIYLGGVFVLLMIILNWPSLVLMTIHEELAKAENVNVYFQNLLLMLLMTIVVAVSIRTVGILLISSMLIIPAATARHLVNSPVAMAITASILGAIAVLGGIFLSMELDTPSGPSIVVTAALLFVILFTFSSLILKK